MRRNLMLPLAAVLLTLTFLLMQADAPDESQNKRVMESLRIIDLDNAALQRDVLRARSGILRNYDPLSDAAHSLEKQAAALAREAESGLLWSDPQLMEQAEALRGAVMEQEELVERFKTQNALLHNSLRVFNRLMSDLAPPGQGPLDAASTAIYRLAAAMVRFLSDPESEAADELQSAAGNVEQLRPLERHASLVAHARMIGATLPIVDAMTFRLQVTATAGRAQTVRDSYLATYSTMEAWARGFRIALYGVAIGLAGYIAFLILRLDRKSELLRQRLVLENLVAATSWDLLNTPHGQLDSGIDQALARVGQHAGSDRVRIILDVPGLEAPKVHSWSDPALDRAEDDAVELLTAACGHRTEQLGEAGSIEVADADRLPIGGMRRMLAKLGLRSWLAITLGPTDKPYGVFSLESYREPRAWSEGDVTVLRTISHIFSTALQREQAEADQEALKARLAHAQRLESLGTLAGGIAHEFNNVLGAMVGYAELALANLRRNNTTQGYIQQILTGGARAKAVIDQILAFSRDQQRSRQPLYAQSVIEEALQLLRASLPATVELRRSLRAPAATIIADATGLQQVVMNLCTNAAHAMGNAGVIDISCEILPVTHPLVLSHGQLKGGRHLRLVVSDTGSGITPADLRRIFEPFFTTKGLGQGTGLGLATVHGIVIDHGGALDVRSRPGKGSSFAVYLPLTSAAVPVEEREAERQAPRGSGQTILLVERERQKLLLAEEMLAVLGYEPIGFDTADAALDRLKASPGAFDLALLDQEMGGPDGLALARSAHHLQPRLPIVLMASSDGALTALRGKPGFVSDVLLKPLRLRLLGELLNRHLAEKTLY
jgi:signal transduction histidine kinase